MRVLLNGQHADAMGNVGWIFTTGTLPHIQGYEMDAKEAQALIDKGGDLTLTIEDLKTVTIKKLSILGEAPASQPYLRTVLVADLRWKWERKLITGRYNCRRRSGQKTLLAPQDQLAQLGQVVDDFLFQPATLNGNTTKWKPNEVVQDVLNKLSQGDGFGFSYNITNIPSDALEVNDLDIRDPGNTALDIAMNHMPGCMVWVNQDGTVVVDTAINLAEATILENMGPEIVDFGHASKVSFQWVRPSKVIVYFVREQEIRHNSLQEGGTTVQGSDDRYMRNVCQVTDPVVSVNGSAMMFGSWVAFDDIFPFWNQTLPTAQTAPIGHTVIQQSFFESLMWKQYVPFGDDTNQIIWAGRLSEIKKHYRQNYQINRRIADRSLQIKPIRAGILDVTTGIRARAQCYSDYCVEMSALQNNTNVATQEKWKNFFALGNGQQWQSTSNIDQLAGASPVWVDVIDEQAGIIHLDYRLDPYGRWLQIYPSIVNNIPTNAMGDKTTPKGKNMIIGRGGSFPQLAANDQKSVILTHVPCAPNDNSQYFKHEVTPDDVAGLVQGLTITPANGPPWEVLIDSGLVTARMAWLDAASAAIERSFGINANIPGALAAGGAAAPDDSATLESLVVNLDDIKATANAIAASLWSQRTDRYIGSRSVRLDPMLFLKGAISHLEHSVDSEGHVISRMTIAGELKQRNYLALLPEGTRKVLFREVIPN